jgi:hypothetical protein
VIQAIARAIHRSNASKTDRSPLILRLESTGGTYQSRAEIHYNSAVGAQTDVGDKQLKTSPAR